MQRQNWAAKLGAAVGALSLSFSSTVSADVLSGPSPVNVSTYGPQFLWSSSSSINGDSLLAWSDSRLGVSGLRRFDGTGLALDAGDWYADGGASTQAAFDKLGNFAIASVQPDGSGKSIFVTMYNRNGTARIGKFRVNATPSARGEVAALSFNSTGRMLVAWAASNPDNSHQIYARTFNMSNATITSAVIAVTPPSFDALVHDAKIDNNGNFGVVWSRTSANVNNNYDVYYQRFSNNGTPLTVPTLVNTYQPGFQAYASLAMNGAGNAVVAWESGDQDGHRNGIYAQRFNSAGAKLGSEFRVNDTIVGNQVSASTAMTEEGNFAVAWISDNQASNPSSAIQTYLKQYFADGTAFGPEKLIYTPPAGTNTYATRMSVTPAGLATIGVRNYSAANDYDVVAIRYLLDTQPAVTSLNSGVAVTGISAPQFGQRLFKIDVPSGKSVLNISVTGPGVGNADLYGKLGVIPSVSNYEFRSVNTGNTETVSISNIPAGSFYFSLYGAAAYSGVTLKVTYQ